jgi:hypothetical protein
MGLESLTPIGAGIDAAAGIYSLISGIGQKARGKRLAEENIRPIYEIPKEIQANQQLAQLYANQGMPAEQLSQAQRNIQQNQAVASNLASTQRGGALAGAGAIQAGSNQATNELAAQSAMMRMQNIRSLMSANQTLAGYRDKAFDYNQAQKYQEQAAAARALQGEGAQNIAGGLSTIGGAALTGLSALKKTASPQQFDVASFQQSAPQLNQSLKPDFSAYRLPPVFTQQPVSGYTPSAEDLSKSAKDSSFDLAKQGLYPDMNQYNF